LVDVDIYIAETYDDFEHAYSLAEKVFSENTIDSEYSLHKHDQWSADPSFKISNLVIARNKTTDKVIGMIRIVPRVIFRGKKEFRVAGISSVCVAPEHRGKGISSILINSTLQECRNRNFDFALLIARRALDHYYTKYGFWGVSSYNQLLVKGVSCSSESDIILTVEEEISPELIEVYKHVYDTCYAECFGRFKRDDRYWEFLITRIKSLPGIRNRSIRLKGKVVGYIVDDGRIIYEIAYIQGRNIGQRVLSSFVRRQQGEVMLEIPANHSLVRDLGMLDKTISFRECRYGGHMIRILNDECQPCSNFLSKSNSYEDTCAQLGIYQVSLGGEGTPFNVGLLDQF